MSSIFSTSACGVGTQTTSLPAWPTRARTASPAPGRLRERADGGEAEGRGQDERTKHVTGIHSLPRKTMALGSRHLTPAV